MKIDGEMAYGFAWIGGNEFNFVAFDFSLASIELAIDFEGASAGMGATWTQIYSESAFTRHEPTKI